MNAARMLALYERIAEAPDAVARLRRFVLDLAVRGKLVAQDPREEPSQELLKRIGRGSSAASELPSNWRRAPVGALMEFQYGKGLPATQRSAEGPVPLFGSNGIVGYTTEALTNQPAVVVGRKGSAGALNLCDGPSWTTDVAYYVEAPTYLALRFLFLSLDALQLGELGKGVKPGLSRSDAYAQQINVPPLAEQHRIVAKMDELMALCDRLEAARRAREATRDRLAAASLARLNAPDPETFPADARFALNALPALTTRPDQIKHLRQTILNLAVRGKLVPQNPQDEPASEILDRVSKLRLRLLERGYPNADEARAQTRKQSEQRIPEGLNTLPQGWTWATLMQCTALVVDCKNKTAPYASDGVRLIRTTNVRDGRMNSVDQKYVDQKTYEVWSARCVPEAGDILITREAPMGEVCIIPPGERVCLGQRMMLARLIPDTIDPNFMLYSLRDPNLLDRVQDKPIGATVQHLRVGGVESLLVPVPPLAEQRRIVRKLDELMALCDALAASLTDATTARTRLLESTLADALAPASAELQEAAE